MNPALAALTLLVTRPATVEAQTPEIEEEAPGVVEDEPGEAGAAAIADTDRTREAAGDAPRHQSRPRGAGVGLEGRHPGPTCPTPS